MSFLSTFSIRKPNSLLVPAMLDLEKISDPGVNFVHWQRLPDEDIHQFGSALLTSDFTGFSLTATALSVREQLQQEFDKSAIHTVGEAAAGRQYGSAYLSISFNYGTSPNANVSQSRE